MQKKECAECERYRNSVGEYFCDNLTEQEKSEFLMHIENCPECKVEYEEFRTIIDAAGELEEVEVPESLKLSVADVLLLEEKAMKKRIDFRKYAVRTFVGAAACVTLAIGVYSGGLYDIFVNSDDVLSTGENIVTEETRPAENNEIQNNIIDNAEEVTPTASENTEAKSTVVNSKNETRKNKPVKQETKKNENVSETDEATAKTETRVNTEKSNGEYTAVAEERSDVSSDAVTKNVVTESQKMRGTRSVADESSAVSGGGGSAGANDIDNVSAYSLDSESIEGAYEESASVNVNASTKGSCTVYADNPESFAKGYGICESGDRISFNISADQWRGFVDYCRSAGVSVAAEFSQLDGESINIIVVKNK